MRVLAFAALALAIAACSQKEAPAPTEMPVTEAAPAEAAPAEAAPEEAAPAPAVAAPPSLVDTAEFPATTTRANIVTSKGDILVELYPNEAPKTVANFLQYAKDGHYDRLIFHRVVPGFVVQGGGYNKYFDERPTRAPVAYEGDNGLKNYRTTLAMARTMDPQSATSQWYINLRDNNETLDHFVNDLGPRYGYTVFGRVIAGMDVVDAIGALPTGAGGPFPAEVPIEMVTITRVDPADARQ